MHNFSPVGFRLRIKTVKSFENSCTFDSGPRINNSGAGSIRNNSLYSKRARFGEATTLSEADLQFCDALGLVMKYEFVRPLTQ